MTLYEISNKANELMALYGFIQKGWVFRFDNAKVRFGRCNHTRKLITLSKPLAMANAVSHTDKIIDTILHEIAHAITRERYPHRKMSAHGYEWQSVCIEIGAKPEARYDGSKIDQVKGKYAYVCPNCGRIEYFFKRLKRKHGCISCCNKYNGGKFSYDYALKLEE